MDRDALLRSLREAFSADLADGVRALEAGLLALERAGPEEREEALRTVFRAAHGLKGGARAAGLTAAEALCHAMESLLGAARDHGRVLDRADTEALLGATDTLGALDRALRDDATASEDAAGLLAAKEAVDGRLASAPGPAGALVAPRRAGAEAGEANGATNAQANGEGTGEAGSVATSGADPQGPPSALPAAVAAADPGRSRGEPAHPGDAAAPTLTAAVDEAGAAPSLQAAAPPRADAAPARPRTVRLSHERLDALAATGADLLLAAREAEHQAARADGVVAELRRARRDVRAARSLLGVAGPSPGATSSELDPGARSLLGAEERLRRLEREVLRMRAKLAGDGRALAHGARRLATDVRELRLVPWTEATAGLERTSRDLASALGKEVEVAVLGAGLEVDQSVASALREPLAHLVRNAVDHGIESPGDRAAAGKPARGTIELSAEVDAGHVHVRVRDDGRGFDADELRDAARRRGVPVPADPARVLELVFLPGFSTRSEVTEVSGRGVGLDIVASAVRAVRGTLTVASERGRGATFDLVLPATLYGLRALIVKEGGQAFALPVPDVVQVRRVKKDALRAAGGQPIVLLDAPVPGAPLSQVLGLPGTSPERRFAVVVASAAAGRRGRPTRRESLAALLVEDVLAERELALEPLQEALAGARFVAGAALLGDGEVAIILRTEDLVDDLRGAVGSAPPPPAASPRKERKLVVLADDAATTRTLARTLLEAAGYAVVAAADGEAALALVRQHGPDLLLSDVEMPRLDGVELTRRLRADARFAHLPIVLLTGLASDEDRQRGLEAGADAYLVKSAFDQRVLLETVSELLEGGGT